MASIAPLAYTLLSIVWFFNLASMIPQIWLNMKIKYGAGISEKMLLLNYTASVTGLLFAYAAHLPLIYRIMAPIGLSILSIIIGQRIYYDKSPKSRMHFIGMFLVVTSFLALLGIILYFKPSYANYVGFIGFCATTISQLPQIYKIAVSGSTYGFSFTSLTIATMSAIIESIAAFILNMPILVKLNGLRALSVYVIFCILWSRTKQPAKKR